jgi:hypothetical protein
MNTTHALSPKGYQNTPLRPSFTKIIYLSNIADETGGKPVAV